MRDKAPGRSCPLRYRYGAGAIALAPEQRVRTLYVVGGLYGNVPALDAVETMARSEQDTPSLCFNGDFNWFDIADSTFSELNRRVLAYDAILGNVEAEFDEGSGDAGCGCAYPDHVDPMIVERSNRIHRVLKATALRHRSLLQRILRLPMFARYRVNDCSVGVVHGDSESLAGWRFDVDALDAPDAQDWLLAAFNASEVDVFASTHTCLPAVRELSGNSRRRRLIINNGSAGMPNFSGEIAGLCTRIATTPSPYPVVHEVMVAGAHVALLPVRYDNARWQEEFIAQWPAGSPAHLSYIDRITRGPRFTRSRAVMARTPSRPELQSVGDAPTHSSHVT